MKATTRRRRCNLCNRLIGAQGFKTHENACLRKQSGISNAAPKIQPKLTKEPQVVLVLSKLHGFLIDADGKTYSPVKLINSVEKWRRSKSSDNE